MGLLKQGNPYFILSQKPFVFKISLDHYAPESTPKLDKAIHKWIIKRQNIAFSFMKFSPLKHLSASASP